MVRWPYVWCDLIRTPPFSVLRLVLEISIFCVVISILVAMSSPQNTDSDSVTHQAWVIDSYGQIKDLQLKPIKKPKIADQNELLIKVNAASINPIDNLMITGYARTLLKILRIFQSEFPLVVGRDFSGIVVQKGNKVGNDFDVGDRVYGIIPLQKQGCFAEYVITEKIHVQKIPEELTFTEAAAIPYAAMTAWSALYPSGKFADLKLPSTKVLILGASGGVGTQAVQIVKAEGAMVVGTCSADAVALVRSLGADFVFNYRDKNYINDVASVGKYDIILDCANHGYDNIPESWNFSVYITLNAPIVNYTDWYGTVIGLLLSAGNYLKSNVGSWMKGRSVQWGFFSPNAQGFAYINKFVHQKKIKPVIQKVFKFTQLPEAMETVKAGHLRGKVVVEYE